MCKRFCALLLYHIGILIIFFTLLLNCTLHVRCQFVKHFLMHSYYNTLLIQISVIKSNAQVLCELFADFFKSTSCPKFQLSFCKVHSTTFLFTSDIFRSSTCHFLLFATHLPESLNIKPQNFQNSNAALSVLQRPVFSLTINMRFPLLYHRCFLYIARSNFTIIFAVVPSNNMCTL